MRRTWPRALLILVVSSCNPTRVAGSAFIRSITPPNVLPRQVLSDFRDADIIFIQSRSAQSRAIIEVQDGYPFTHAGLLFRRNGSWHVLEAVATVRWTPLERFRARGGGIRVMRANLTDNERARVRAAAMRFLGTRYDTRFEWSDSRIYCTELVWKAFDRALHRDIGGVQDWSEMELGAVARALLSARGGTRPRGKIVTPKALATSSDLVVVWED